MNRKVLWSILILLVLAGGFIGLVHWLGHETIGPAGFRRLQPGMPHLEVRNILGPENSSNGWPRNYDAKLSKDWGPYGFFPPPHYWAYWESPRFVISICFDSENNAVIAIMDPNPNSPRSIWHRFRSLL